MLDDNGMSAISIFNNDFGIKFFEKNFDEIEITIKFNYMFLASWFEKWNIYIVHMEWIHGSMNFS